MRKLFYIPIELLEERYTTQWYNEFPKEFRKEFDVMTIDGTPLTSTIKTGTFLDMNSTIAYKNSQMSKIAELFYNKLIPDNSVFFFGDTEFWGLESLRLMADMNKVKNIKIYSFLHAASYTKEDAFVIAEPYQKYTELGWILSCDKVFVGSQYHKNAFLERRANALGTKEDAELIAKKIVVTGNPLFKEVYHKLNNTKKQKIVITNRFDWEKRPNLSLDFAFIIKSLMPEVEIVVTTGRKEFKSNKNWLEQYGKAMEKAGIITIKSGLTKEEYHTELQDAKVMLSNSIEENFGYCIAEAIHYNTYPLCSNSLSHPELCENDKDLLFDDLDEIIPKIQKLLKMDKDITHYNNKYHSALDNIIKEMLN